MSVEASLMNKGVMPTTFRVGASRHDIMMIPKMARLRPQIAHTRNALNAGSEIRQYMIHDKCDLPAELTSDTIRRVAMIMLVVLQLSL